MSVTASGVVRTSPVDREQVNALAEMHTRLLPRSMPAQLGHHFMTRFYFTELVASELISCELYAHENRYVAFNVYTTSPDSLLSVGIRRHFAALVRASAWTFATDPRRLAAAVSVLRKSAELRQDGGARAGYWLTFGVLESFRRLRVEEGGTRISNILVNSMLDDLKTRGFTELHGGVERENKSAILFYHSCGFSIHDPGSGPALKIRYDLTRSEKPERLPA